MEPIEQPKWGVPDNPLTARQDELAIAVRQLVDRVNYLQGLIEGHIERFKQHRHLVSDVGETTTPND